MSCTPPPVRTLTLAIDVPVWSKGGVNPGDSDVFVLSDDSIAQVAPLISRLRATLTTANPTLNFQCRPVLQATNDGCAWDAAVDIDAAHAGKGSWTSSWYTDPTKFTRGIRFGVIAGQAAGSIIVEQARITLIIDIELKS